MNLIGRSIRQPAGFNAFIPERFPPVLPPLSYPTQALLEKANVSLGRLDGLTMLLPDADFFVAMYVRHESVLSSRVEGTQATMIDALRHENHVRSGLPDDVNDIFLHIRAMNEGLARMTDFPLSGRLLREVHRVLMTGGRATGYASPGEYRTTQNWIGGASPASAMFVPPPADVIPAAMSDLERFLHAEDDYPALLKAGLAHAQFETIHPFPDGNGRTGRLLITFFLVMQGVLAKPVLYMSDYFLRHREAYFQHLHDYHSRGSVEAWLAFFFGAVAETADKASRTARGISTLRDRDRELVATLGRSAAAGIELLEILYRLPLISVTTAASRMKKTRANTNNLVNKFVKLGILKQTDEEATYGRLFIHSDYLALFQEDTAS